MFQRHFNILSQAWYSQALRGMPYVDNVTIIVNDIVDDNIKYIGEFSICWYHLKDGLVAPKLEAFDDSWAALGACPDVIKEFAAISSFDKSHTVEEVVAVLKRCGIIDGTPREVPDHLQEMADQ